MRFSKYPKTQLQAQIDYLAGYLRWWLRSESVVSRPPLSREDILNQYLRPLGFHPS